jgi:hypothetical protein
MNPVPPPPFRSSVFDTAALRMNEHPSADPMQPDAAPSPKVRRSNAGPAATVRHGSASVPICRIISGTRTRIANLGSATASGCGRCSPPLRPRSKRHWSWRSRFRRACSTSPTLEPDQKPGLGARRGNLSHDKTRRRRRSGPLTEQQRRCRKNGPPPAGESH